MLLYEHSNKNISTVVLTFNKNTHLDHHDPILLHVHNWTGLQWILVMLTNVDLLSLIFLEKQKYKIQLPENVDGHHISYRTLCGRDQREKCFIDHKECFNCSITHTLRNVYFIEQLKHSLWSTKHC